MDDAQSEQPASADDVLREQWEAERDPYEVLRGRPVSPPELLHALVGRNADLASLTQELTKRAEARPAWTYPKHPRHSQESPDTSIPALVLYGPPGVGKSALAAALAERMTHLHTHWLILDEDAADIDVDVLLLRLLAEVSAPRTHLLETVRKYLRHCRTAPSSIPPGLTETVRDVFASRAWRERLLVLDGAPSAAARSLLRILVDAGANVIVTARQSAPWEGSGAHLHPVEPLTARQAFFLAKEITGSLGGRARFATGPRRTLVDAAKGLPVWIQVAVALMRESPVPRLPADAGPDALLDLVLERLDDQDRKLLELVAACPGDGRFSLRDLNALNTGLPGWLPAKTPLARFVERGLAVRVGPVRGTFHCVPSAVAEAVRLRLTSDQRQLIATRASELLTQAALERMRSAAVMLTGTPSAEPGVRGMSTEPADLLLMTDRLLDLIGKRSLSPQQRQLACDALLPVLAVHGDAHRLVAVHVMAIRHTEHTLTETAVDALVHRLDPLHWTDRHGTAQHHFGDLRAAPPPLENADTLVEEAWSALFHGAQLCDRGEPEEAEAQLLYADRRYVAAGCGRGHGWAMLHLARANLLLYRLDRADELLTDAAEVLSIVGDKRGMNWVETQRVLLLLMQGHVNVAESTARSALTAHTVAEDVRGTGWTCLNLGLVHMARRSRELARVVLMSALRHFHACGDELGQAWAKHRLALVNTAGTIGDTYEFPALADDFIRLGCTHGGAWSLLEAALQERDPIARTHALASAQELFDRLHDRGGLMWVAAVRLLGQGADDIKALTPDLPPAADGYLRLRRLHTQFVATALKGAPVLPFDARDLIVVPPRLPERPDATPPDPAQSCHVRLTLLDDAPSPGSTARLLLRVVPHEAHPWASADGAGPPWLAATAVPLTHASVEPATALLRPSDQPTHGGEFAFTAHRPGLHRIRFTIALEGTGAVLQQVETEIDILDTGRPEGHAAPHTTTLRGR